MTRVIHSFGFSRFSNIFVTKVATIRSQHVYEIRPRKDHRGVDLISDALSFGACGTASHAIGYATFRSRSHNAVIPVYDEAGKVTETYEHAGEFREP
jgi:hypothetical protein